MVRVVSLAALTVLVALSLFSGEIKQLFASRRAATTVAIPDVPFVPTPPHVVDAMLRLAKVTADDMVFDLGCGDGRVVFAAVREFGARGVGIDTNPALIEACRTSAAAQKLEDQVEFRLEDILASDLAEATVITLYLSQEMNNKLTPRFETLPPGVRIASHDFELEGIQPERVEQASAIGHRTAPHRIYLYVTPLTPLSTP